MPIRTSRPTVAEEIRPRIPVQDLIEISGGECSYMAFRYNTEASRDLCRPVYHLAFKKDRDRILTDNNQVYEWESKLFHTGRNGKPIGDIGHDEFIEIFNEMGNLKEQRECFVLAVRDWQEIQKVKPVLEHSLE